MTIRELETKTRQVRFDYIVTTTLIIDRYRGRAKKNVSGHGTTPMKAYEAMYDALVKHYNELF